MKVLTVNDLKLLNICIKNELELIEKGFEISELTGKLFLQNAISDFKESYLRRTYGNIVPALSTEYRYFIVGILKGLKDEYRDVATTYILIPEFGDVSNDILFEALSNKCGKN